MLCWKRCSWVGYLFFCLWWCLYLNLVNILLKPRHFTFCLGTLMKTEKFVPSSFYIYTNVPSCEDWSAVTLVSSAGDYDSSFRRFLKFLYLFCFVRYLYALQNTLIVSFQRHFFLKGKQIGWSTFSSFIFWIEFRALEILEYFVGFLQPTYNIGWKITPFPVTQNIKCPWKVLTQSVQIWSSLKLIWGRLISSDHFQGPFF